MHEQPRFDEIKAAVCAREAEMLDEHASHRDVEQPFSVVARRLALRHVEEARLVGVVREQRRREAVGYDVRVRPRCAAVEEQTGFREGRGRRRACEDRVVHRGWRGGGDRQRGREHSGDAEHQGIG